MEVNKQLRLDVDKIINQLLIDINPYNRTFEFAKNLKLNSGRNILVSIGKAAWPMAKAISDYIDIDQGAIITKYGHSNGELPNIKVFEAGHPISDENSIIATDYVLDLTSDLKENDNIILCISGGGSALFEKPLIELKELQDINDQLIKSGADINEINTIRKRLSSVKAGRFALHCAPSHIEAIILSDVIGNDLSTIASGPVSKDITNSSEAINIVNKYNIQVNEKTKQLLNIETPKEIRNVSTHIIASVEQLCEYTKNICEELGYVAEIILNNCKDNVNDIVNKFEDILKVAKPNSAYIIGGECSVEVKGNGLGGRNAHLALLCSKIIKDKTNSCIFTFGSDGTDGPTDAAGGIVDGQTYLLINADEYINNFDSYHALEKINSLIKTGPTGSNVNDIYVLLIK